MKHRFDPFYQRLLTVSGLPACRRNLLFLNIKNPTTTTMQNVPNYRTLNLAVAMLLAALPLTAQVDKALKLIENEKLDGVETMLRAGLTDDVDRVIAYYGLARIYAVPEYPAFQLDSAYSYIESAQAAYKSLDSQGKSRVAKDLNSSEIGKLRTAILKTALQKAEDENTISAYQYFLDNYPESGSRYEGKAVSSRNKLAYDEAHADGTEAAYTKLLDSYGPDLKARNRDLYDAAQKRQFELFLEREGWPAYHDFAERYPDNIYVRDSMYEKFHDLWFGPVEDYNTFILNYPEVPITKYAIDSLGYRLAEIADSALSPVFIQKYPEHPARNGVYGTWYESLKPRFRSLADLERFKTAHPDFPYPERYATDAEIFLDQSYEKLEVGKALGAFRAFIDKNPTYSKIDSVWWRYYQTFKMQMPGLDNLDKFGKAHPQFPFPELLEADRKQLQKGSEDDAWLQIRSSEGTPELFRYLKNHPNSPYREAAVDLLAQRLLEEGQPQSIEGFLREQGDHPMRRQLLEKLWEVFPGKENTDAIAAFGKKHPDFPHPEWLQEALDTAPPNDAEVLTFKEELRPGFVKYIRKYAPEPKAFEALWRMLAVDFVRQDWDAAYANLQQFAPQFGDGHAEYQQWLAAFDPAKRMQAGSISSLVNTELEEYSAVISADDQTLYFCRNVATSPGAVNEDLYISRRDAAGKWQEAQPIAGLITKGNEAPEAISADGNNLLIFLDGNICSSQKTRLGWSKPKPLSTNINRSFWQADARITADGKAIIFTSEVGMLRGNKDIFISFRQEDGSWGPATSLGEGINTDQDDRSAFLHPDMKTMYFSSAGHRGLGGLDIFVSRRLDDSWTNWSTPVNLGPGINTADHDWSFKVTTDGKQGYYNVLSKELGGDIFIMPLQEAFQPDPVATVSGRLTAMSGEAIGAEINWINLQTGEVIQTTSSDPIDGTFFATLPSLGKYGYSIKKENYFPVSGNLDFSKKLFHQRLEKALTIVTVAEMQEKDLAISLNNLFFETARYDIQPASFPELNGLASWIKKNELAIEIYGHTDTVGDDTANLLLSENRAKAVRDYLVAQGLTPEHIIAKGFGESQPVASNETDAGRAQNRRVEIKIARNE